MSEALVWTILKKNNGKVMKRTHPASRMTTEKGSLRNKGSRKDCGFSHSRAVDVSPNDDGIPILSMRNEDVAAQRRPDRMWNTVTLSGGVRSALAKAEVILEPYPTATRVAALGRISNMYQVLMRKNRGADHTALLQTSQ